MRYVMRQELLPWGDDLVVRDESGRDVFYMVGKVFSLGKKAVLTLFHCSFSVDVPGPKVMQATDGSSQPVRPADEPKDGGDATVISRGFPDEGGPHLGSLG